MTSPEPEPEPETENDDTMVFSIDIGIKLIPEFDGNRQQLHKFLACCDIVSKTASSANDKTAFLNLVKTKLCGRAYNSIKYKNIDTWDNLKDILKTQYSEKRTMSQIQMELLTSSQGNDDVRTFADRIEKLQQDLTDVCIDEQGNDATDIIQSMNQKSALKAFIEGLNEPIKFIVKASRFNSLYEAVELAAEEERNVKCSKSFKNSNRPVTQNQSFHKNNSNNSISCRYCHKLGHSIEQCRKRQYNNSKRYNSSPNFNQNNNQVVSNTVSHSNDFVQNNDQGNEPGPSTHQGRGTRVRDLKTAQRQTQQNL